MKLKDDKFYSLKIRLPDDYISNEHIQVTLSDETKLTLAEYMFQQNVFTNEIADKIIRDNLNYFKDLPKPTRKQRLKWWWQDKVQRAKDIWTILSGGDVHKDCGY